MSLTIIKAGVLDTIQDMGRRGFKHLGINSGGVMDTYSAGLANALLGKSLNEPVIEMHFPAPVIKFSSPCIIVITGADFSPQINDQPVQLNRPLIVGSNAVITFKKRNYGARCYLAVLEKWRIDPWLNSYSTNIIAQAGGFAGRPLKSGDIINYELLYNYEKLLNGDNFIQVPWSIPVIKYTSKNPIPIQFLKGPEWNFISAEAQLQLVNTTFTITSASDTMGYRLSGKAIKQQEDIQLLSSGVTFGTVQLLPNGQLIILMADHQTTGGYPRIATVAATNLPVLAQLHAGSTIVFKMIDHEEAVKSLAINTSYLLTVKNASEMQVKKVFK